MDLTQDMLNVEFRNKSYVDILMFVQNTDIQITNVSSNGALAFSNLQSIIDPTRYSSYSMATLERGLWVLDGTFFNPNAGQKYDGFISNNMSDNNGDFVTNPKIDISLLQSYNIEFVSMIFNAAIDSAYPKQVIVRFKNAVDTVISTTTVNCSEIDTMPSIILEANEAGVASVQLEFVGTMIPHRRIRLSTFMFGKLEIFTQDEIKSSRWLDKQSLVADTLATRTFEFTLFNYDKRYNIDNPATNLPLLNRTTELLIRWGYDHEMMTKWTEMKRFRLTDVRINADDTVTFTCGSSLDILDMIFDRDIYNGPRTVSTVVSTLLSFAGMPADTIIYDDDYANVMIDRPLPNLAVRQLIQLCAFACGATLQILDNGKIRFANLNLDIIKSRFNYNDFLSVPMASQLPYTYDIALTRNTSTVEEDESQLVTQTITTFNASISYPAAMSPYIKTITGGTITNAQFFATRVELQVNFTGDSCEIEIWGHRIDTATNIKKSATSSTLVVDSQLAVDPLDSVTEKYVNWYSRKFKYMMDTRGEPLISATDVIEIQSPFTEVTLENVKGYVLSNEINYDGAWTGKMEVIAL